VGLRGLVYGEIHVQAGGRICTRASTAARRRIAAGAGRDHHHAQDKDGRIHIPGFYDRVEPPSPKEKEAWARLPFNEAEYLEKEIGAKSLTGEPATTSSSAPGRGPRSKYTHQAGSLARAPRR